MRLNASLKQEMIDFLAIYDVLQYFFSKSFPVECGSHITELPTITVIPSERKCRQSFSIECNAERVVQLSGKRKGFCCRYVRRPQIVPPSAGRQHPQCYPLSYLSCRAGKTCRLPTSQNVFALSTRPSRVSSSLRCSYITLCQGFRDLRNAYSMILDKIEKNYEKLTNPKGVAAHMQHELLYQCVSVFRYQNCCNRNEELHKRILKGETRIQFAVTRSLLSKKSYHGFEIKSVPHNRGKELDCREEK